MRNDAARSSETLDAALTKGINGITDENALNWFNHVVSFENQLDNLFCGTSDYNLL